MGEYKYNYSNLKRGQLFKDFTALFEAITGQKPSTGARNRAAHERELSRHIKYCKASEINPEITSKRAIIVQEIYDTPLELHENRGKRGKYSDYLKPLLLVSCGCSSFEGKMCRLANSLGIFEKYTLDQLNNTDLWKPKNKIDKLEINPWKIEAGMMPGQQQYVRTLWNQIRATIERSLDALQKEKIVTWQYYHQLIPDILIDIVGSKDKRPKSRSEIQENEEKKNEFLKEVLPDVNSVLLPETIETLNIYSEKWAHPMKYDTLKDTIYLSSMESPHEFPIRATSEQEEAISNLTQFMHQYACKKCYKLKTLPPIEKVPNEFEFFQNSHLAEIYKQMVEEMYPWLINCKVIWKELEYKVIGTSEQLENYIDTRTFEGENYAQSLSWAYLNYMDSRMEKIMFYPTKKTLSDLKEKRFGKISGPMIEQPLEKSKAACALHEKLKQFYNTST